MDAPHDPTDRPTDRPADGSAWTEMLPLTTVETFVAAMIEAGPEVAEHMVRAANELLLAAQALMGAAERRLAEQRRLRDAETDGVVGADGADGADGAVGADGVAGVAGSTAPVAEPAPDTARLRSVDEVA